MTPERLKEILALRDNHYGGLPYAFPRSFEHRGGIIDPRGITEDEDREIRARWETMSGGSCYLDALLTFAF